MHCKRCREISVNNAFVKGCEISKSQKEKLKYELILPLFRNVYWIVQEDEVILKVESLHRLVELHGVEFNDAYRNRNSDKEILSYIAASVRKKLIETLKSSICFGMSFDCSQDISSMEQLVISVKYINSRLQVEEQFLKLLTVMEKDSESIFIKLRDVFIKEGLFNKLVAVSTDDEPKIASRKKGVIGKLLTPLPYLIHIHCICHQVILRVKEIFKQKKKQFVP